MAMDEEVATSILKLVCDVAEDHNLVATLVHGSRVGGYAREDSLYDCVAICEYPGGTRYHHERLGGAGVAILEIDNELFLLDVQKGALGEFVAGRMLFPYIGLKGTSYLMENEIEFKTRVVREETEDLIRQFGEASRGLLIRPEYFALSRVLRKTKAYPPLRYSYLNTFCENLRQRNMAKVMPGYNAAIRELVEQGILDQTDEGVTVRDDFVDKVLARKNKDKVVNVVEVSKKALYSYVMHGRAGLVSPEMISRELASKVRREFLLTGSTLQVEDPKEHLFFKALNRLVPVDERGNIRDIIIKMRPNSKIAISPLGGVLNEVYLVAADGERLVVKKFSDWHGFKWFTLNLVTLGTKVFSVSGKARLSNEFGMIHLLKKNGVNVPEILHISVPERVLVERYVEGESVTDVVRKTVGQEACPEDYCESIVRIGQSIGMIHSLGIQMGDSKPENFLRAPTGPIYIIDLEQARKRGDFAWDIAEFLYYSAHYATTQTSNVRHLAESFISGYLEKGDPINLRKAAGLNYLKVFSFWALPQINYVVSETLRKATQ